ncbi:MAG: hypothetical protein JWN73_4863 [Betaproteobacteria bacterium]|nr:hypothetical protein [Betaproteobacteria bacterium]
MVSFASFLHRHPWLRAALALATAFVVLLAGLLAVFGYKNHHAQAMAEETCAEAKPGGSLNEFRAVMRARAYDLREATLRSGEPVLMVSFSAIGIESYVCVVSARGEQIVSAEVNFHD